MVWVYGFIRRFTEDFFLKNANEENEWEKYFRKAAKKRSYSVCFLESSQKAGLVESTNAGVLNLFDSKAPYCPQQYLKASFFS